MTHTQGYAFCTIGVGGVVRSGDRYLLIRKKTGRYTGSWTIPGGYVEPGELIDRVVVREVQEETAIIASVDELVLVRNRVSGTENSIYMVFSMTPQPGNCRANETEVDRAEYVTDDEIQNMSSVLHLARVSIKKVHLSSRGFSTQRHPEFPPHRYKYFS